MEAATDLAITLHEKSKILVLGDSHADILAHSEIAVGFPGHAFEVASVAGATISGLENPNYFTQAKPIFDAVLQSSRAATIIRLPDEVDLGFVICWRDRHTGAAAEEML